MSSEAEEVPRAKRLKLLREAKARKEGKDVAEDKVEAEEEEQEPSKEREQAAEEEEELNLAPKRANWDIERDIEPMLKKLERRTQHTIVEILREKMAEQESESDDE